MSNSPQSSQIPADPARGRWLTSAISLAVIAVIIAGGCWAYDCARTADRMERTLHACVLASDLLEEYVIQTNGYWPSSWDELQSRVASVKSGSMYSWPRDRQDVERLVIVDFAAPPSALARGPVEDFKPLKPSGPCYRTYDRHFASLRDALRRFHPEDGTGSDQK